MEVDKILMNALDWIGLSIFALILGYFFIVSKPKDYLL